MDKKNIMLYETVTINDENTHLVIIDQTKLPNETKILHLNSQKEIWEAIYKLKVRGAPAIGVAAAIGAYLAAKEINTNSYEEFYKEFKEATDYLNSSRPTAVNLSWALERMKKVVQESKDKSIEEIKKKLLEEAKEIKEEDVRVCRSIGEYGLTLIKPNMGILTHCNAGQLATAKYGTALSPIYLGNEKGYNLRVFADETRPLLQGARLTAYELQSSGVDVTLICDNMASIVMKNGWIDAIFVGCDRVAANGDAANKIGTSGVAAIAKYYNIPFYICAPTSTIDMNCPTGNQIHIEERPGEEITEMWYEKRMGPKGIKTYNPAFDVTDNELITAIITEYGIARPPYSKSIKEIFLKKNKS